MARKHSAPRVGDDTAYVDWSRRTTLVEGIIMMLVLIGLLYANSVAVGRAIDIRFPPAAPASVQP